MECASIATMEELKEALQVRKKVFVEEQGVDEKLEWDEYDVSPQACRHFAVREDGRAVAAGRWKEFEPGTAKFQRIAVLPEFRGRSVGRLLVEAMEADARERGYGRIVLDAQVTAEPFYRRLGYAILSPEPFLDAGIPHVRMGKNA